MEEVWGSRFREEADGRLRLVTGRCFYTVARTGGELAVHFEPGVSGFQAVDFKVPIQMDDFWQWVAFVTALIVGSPERWRSLRKAVGDEMPEDLVDLLNIGVDHLVEATGTEAEETRPKMTAADLPELLQVRKRLERTRDAAWEQLRQATQN